MGARGSRPRSGQRNVSAALRRARALTVVRATARRVVQRSSRHRRHAPASWQPWPRAPGARPGNHWLGHHCCGCCCGCPWETWALSRAVGSCTSVRACTCVRAGCFMHMRMKWGGARGPEARLNHQASSRALVHLRHSSFTSSLLWNPARRARHAADLAVTMGKNSAAPSSVAFSTSQSVRPPAHGGGDGQHGARPSASGQRGAPPDGS